MRKNLQRSIVRSLGRYIAIVAIIALGTAMFVGLQQTKVDMVATGQQFTDEQNMFDLRLVSTVGWSREQVAQVAALEGVSQAEGVFYLDVLGYRNGESNETAAYRFYALPRQMNQVALRGGRMPENAGECLADGYRYDESILGTTVTVCDDNADSTLDTLRGREFTVVGLAATPLYMDMNRGSTGIGNGTLSSYFYMMEDAFEADYYPEIHVTIPGEYEIFSEEYDRALEDAGARLEVLAAPLGQERYIQVRQQSEEDYAEGLAQYEDGLKEFEEGRQEALEQLAQAEEQLNAAQAQLEAAQAQLRSGEAQIAEGKATLMESRETLETFQTLYDTAASALYAPLDATQAELEARQTELQGELTEIDTENAALDAEIQGLYAQMGAEGDELAQLNQQIPQLQLSIATLDAGIWATQSALDAARLFPTTNAALIAQLEERLAQQNAQRGDYAAQLAAAQTRQEELSALLEAPFVRLEELAQQKAALEARRVAAEQSLALVGSGLDTVAAGREAADRELADIRGQLEDAQTQLEAGEKELLAYQAQLYAASIQLEQGKKELEQSRLDFEAGKEETERRLAEGEAELAEVAEKLAAARETLDGLSGEIFVLDRNSNVGYASLETNSDIVYSISKILPIFFVLIACLVCVTTMTRMIDEERTQIGTLKALGYGSFAIMNKYLVYAGSASLLGSVLGCILGSTVFPKILWQAYCIMIYIQPEVVLTANWPLCVSVTLMYILAMVFTGWYCCHRTLREVPAQLIRPKPPASGKQILLEKLPMWRKISFLNKVTIRNIFRYRQRMAMMLVGIGGCTALLVTGFGLRDTISGIAGFQFDEVTTYDLQVYFSQGQSDEAQEAFRSQLGNDSQGVLFYSQQNVDIEAGGSAREIYMMSVDGDISPYMNLHSGDTPLALPGTGETLLTIGVAEALGIRVGDEITLRDPDMRNLTLTVAGIYDNYVYNYAIVTPQTLSAQWGEAPQEQMAMVKIADGEDVHNVSTRIVGMTDVLNVSVSVDTADMVGGMMDALDLVVVVIVICAGALGAIVLYNLTNININERIREIATIKVLGFRAGETGAYVFKENLALTVAGILLGLPLGRWFLGFVMDHVKINMVWFQPKATALSYVISALITMAAALIVDLIFYFKLERINMAEALKSVE